MPSDILYGENYRESELEKCVREGRQGLVDCHKDELRRRDYELNKIYQRALSRLSKRQQYKLTSSERVWLRQRDSECPSPYRTSKAVVTKDDEMLWYQCLIDRVDGRIDTIRVEFNR
jgi:uncharacterized protein YecT (DUF1311 family)